MPSLWNKENKTYTLFGSTISMPAAPKKAANRPLVLLFDIGGVCVRKITLMARASAIMLNSSRLFRPSKPSLTTKGRKESHSVMSTGPYRRPIPMARGKGSNAVSW